MSSSGLIYAVIVGAWAAYLVPMWLRRQDELNEARPTERFSTAIRLLSGRAAMERRITRSLDDRNDETPAGEAGDPSGVPPEAPVPAPEPELVSAAAPEPAPAPPVPAPRPTRAEREARAGAQRRAKLLARRRRMVTVLFIAFSLGAIVAGVGGLAFLWAPAVPAVLLSLYIGRLRRQERLRYEVKLDRRRAAEAAQRLRERERQRRRSEQSAAPQPQPPQRPQPHQSRQSHQSRQPHQGRRPARPARAARQPRPAEAPQEPPADAPAPAAECQALVEATDHEEWVDGLRERSADPDSWDPVPVPLPTYVTAPVAPRSTGALDLNAPDAWSAGRVATPPPTAAPQRDRTPLFDQYADPESAVADHPRPRAANE
ncbi:divisome protein SepX/GlpR [Peterkaempfera bronchialis]|uniref:Uncharacterized protein n=1 Tax=Peterkaempfera bronchialis TaxID=2126346 RepID=A0A345SZG3_9ACTN|nr:gephyrin-like molybdotransferase receptor GlpR [Peterkaempfera bronchialis]AXI79118.1 hypothetical protein C7M71_018540 [Peterkaempfera bronchialis]